MNKPAAKEPSMDEILSSIRQIIADDDAAMPGRRQPAPVAPAQPGAQRPAPETKPAEPAEGAEGEPLALSVAQIVPEGQSRPADGADKDDDEGPDLVEPNDIAFEPTPEIEAKPTPRPAFGASTRPSPPASQFRPSPRITAPPPPPRSVSDTAPLPDRKLSADLAEELIEPTTRAAVQQNFARLNTLSNSLSVSQGGPTIEEMIRDMLRPMLKDWLDEHLPAVVERMVEKEIARISRGGGL